MKMNYKKTVLALVQAAAILFFSMSAVAAQDLQRFEIWMDILQKSTDGAFNGITAVENLKANPKSRIAAFNLQALGLLYSKVDPQFTVLKKEFKKIEDGLGQIDKWNNIGNDKNKAKATKKFADQLEKEGWNKAGDNSKIGKIKKDLKQALKSLPDSDSLLVAQLVKDLAFIDSTSFNFSILETGNGLHEFRRQIRWFMIESQVLNGLITFRNPSVSCGITEYDELLSLPIAKSKYSSLTSNPALQKTCPISQCYFVALSDAVEKLGALKDKAEMAIGNTTSDTTPPDLAKAAQEISDQIHATRLLKILQSEIGMCL